MRLFYFRGEHGVANFGDELNQYIWPRLLSGAFDEDDGTQFVGIGTLLNDRLPRATRTVVFGAGVGYYGPPRPSDDWTIFCVRGPLSARALDVAPEMAVTDPGVLIARIHRHSKPPGSRWPRAFMPHWQSEVDAWRRVCAEIGIGFIDPRWQPDEVLDALHKTDLLITEAMHGAIVADAFRIPWVAVRTSERIKRFKWEDWCQSMALEYRPLVLPTIWPETGHPGVVQRVRRRAKRALASRALATVARTACPILSRADILHARMEELERRLELVRTSRRSLIC